MVEKTKYVRTLRITTDPENQKRSPKNMVAVVMENIESKLEDCIVIQFLEGDSKDFHLSHLEYITEKEYFVRKLQGPDEIE